MPDDDTFSLPFSHVPAPSPYRLLELPPTLLPLLTSSSPPPLHLRATTAPPTAPASSPLYNAVLTTPTQTFTLRQVQTSNHIYLIHPTSSGHILATGTATSHLEVTPASFSLQDTIELLRPHLKLYSALSDINSHNDGEDLEEPVTRQGLASEIPISDGEFDTAWRELMAFEYRGKCYIPSAGAVVKAMKTVFVGCQAEGVRLDGDEGVRVEDVVDAVDKDEGIPEGLVGAVVRGVCGRVEKGDNGERWRLEKERAVRCAGRRVLEAWEEKSDMLYIAFMSKWKDAVPDSCKDLCKRDLVKEWYTQPTPSTVRYNPSGVMSGSAASSGTPAAAAAPAPSTAKNKWHEKFRKGKVK